MKNFFSDKTSSTLCFQNQMFLITTHKKTIISHLSHICKKRKTDIYIISRRRWFFLAHHDNIFSLINQTENLIEIKELSSSEMKTKMKVCMLSICAPASCSPVINLMHSSEGLWFPFFIFSSSKIMRFDLTLMD